MAYFFSRIEKAKVCYKDPETILEHLAAIVDVVEKCRNVRCGLKIEIMQGWTSWMGRTGS